MLVSFILVCNSVARVSGVYVFLSKTHGSTHIGRVRPQSSRMCFWRGRCSRTYLWFGGRTRSTRHVVVVLTFLAVRFESLSYCRQPRVDCPQWSYWMADPCFDFCQDSFHVWMFLLVCLLNLTFFTPNSACVVTVFPMSFQFPMFTPHSACIVTVT